MRTTIRLQISSPDIYSMFEGWCTRNIRANTHRSNVMSLPLSYCIIFAPSILQTIATGFSCWLLAYTCCTLPVCLSNNKWIPKVYDHPQLHDRRSRAGRNWPHLLSCLSTNTNTLYKMFAVSLFQCSNTFSIESFLAYPFFWFCSATLLLCCRHIYCILQNGISYCDAYA